PNLARRLVHPQDAEQVMKAYGAFQRGDTMQFRAEYRLFGADRRSVWVRHVARKDAERVYGLLLDVSDEKAAEEAALRSALHDAGTGLYNRGGFYAVAEQQLRIAQRNRSPLVLLVAEIVVPDAMKGMPAE